MPDTTEIDPACSRWAAIGISTLTAKLMSMAYEQTGPVPEERALAHAGLENGGEIVLDYVDHNECGIALEHLLYVINEPPLVVSEEWIKILARIAKTLEMPFTSGESSA